VDAYDVLNLSLDASAEDVKKAYRRLSLQLHPDKVKAGKAPPRRDGATPEESFQELKAAYDVLQDADRRSVYDSFGVDLGPVTPGQEVWSIGMMTLVAPMGSFTLKTLVACCARWLASCVLVKLAVLVGGLSGGLLLSRGFEAELRLGSWSLGKPLTTVVHLGAAGMLFLLHSAWPVLFDTACLVYLVSEVIGIEVLATSGQLAGVIAVGCFVVAWLFSRWWTWFVYLELGLLGMAVLASYVAAFVLRTFIQEAKVQHVDKVKAARQSLRKGRQDLLDLIERLTKRAEAKGLQRR